MINYDLVELDLSTAGRRLVEGLPEGTNYLTASIPDGAAPVYARIGRPEAPRLNLARFPVLHSTCGGFGLVVFEWEATADAIASILLAEDLESSVSVA